MKRRRRRGDRFSEESVDPMNYVSNLSDAMLVLAVGMMLALIVHWNVDISTGGRSSENVGETVAAEGQGGQSAIDRDDALSFTPEELEQMDSTEGETDEGMEKLGEVFAAALFGSVLLGRFSVTPKELFRLLLSRLTETEPGWRDGAENVVFQIRLPRVAAAALIGAALAVAGVSYQGMFRNPMVSPDILGASTGAGFGAALAILLGAGYFGISASAFVFGLLAVAAAYAVSCMSRTNQTIALILAGMMVSSLFSAGTSYLKLVADTQQQLPAITYWLMGSLSSIKPRDVLFLVIPVTLGLVPLLILSWRMNLLTLGEEEARSMGVNTRLLRFTVILCATLLTASSVAVSGMIGWVGLVIPHFCRMLFGYDYRRLIPAAALFGASFLIIVDDIARLATAGEIPLGILTAFVGAPIFLYLILTGGARRGN